MLFETIIISIYFFVVAMGIMSSALLLFKLKKYASNLPENWKNASSLKTFQLSICFLMIFLTLVLTNDGICVYLSRHHTYNNFVISIYYTASTPFLFGFLFINTQTKWKKMGYLILYMVQLTHLISGGYYHLKSVLSSITELILNGTYFLAFLLHLTDLLVRPKKDYFNFQIKMGLAFLIWSLLATIVTSFLATSFTVGDLYFDFFYLANIFSIIILYLCCAFIFITEILKLRRG